MSTTARSPPSRPSSPPANSTSTPPTAASSTHRGLRRFRRRRPRLRHHHPQGARRHLRPHPRRRTRRPLPRGRLRGPVTGSPLRPPLRHHTGSRDDRRSGTHDRHPAPQRERRRSRVRPHSGDHNKSSQALRDGRPPGPRPHRRARPRHDLAALTHVSPSFASLVRQLRSDGIDDPSDDAIELRLATEHRRRMHVGGRVNARDWDNVGTIEHIDDDAGEASSASSVRPDTRRPDRFRGTSSSPSTTPMRRLSPRKPSGTSTTSPMSLPPADSWRSALAVTEST